MTDLSKAHKNSSKHREEILSSESCACFYCKTNFPPSKIAEWTDNGQTAICPNCEVDSVIGDASGIALNQSFLTRMHQYWF